MESSAISLESQLFERTKQYLSLQVSFNELARWVQLHEGEWSIEPDDGAGQLAGTIMLAAYEVWDAARPEESGSESARGMITQEAVRILGVPSGR